jgi:hypothetical protein
MASLRRGEKNLRSIAMDDKRKSRQEAIQWVLAVIMVLGGLVVWRLTSAQIVHAQEARPDSGTSTESCN